MAAAMAVAAVRTFEVYNVASHRVWRQKSAPHAQCGGRELAFTLVRFGLRGAQKPETRRLR